MAGALYGAWRHLVRNIERQDRFEWIQRNARLRPESEPVETPFGRFYMSPIEVRLYRSMTATGMNPVPQFCARGYFLDFAFPALKLGVEADSRAHHSGPKRYDDAQRDQHLHYSGWTVIHLAGPDIHRDPGECAHRVHARVKDGGGCPTDQAALTAHLTVAAVIVGMVVVWLLRYGTA